MASKLGVDDPDEIARRLMREGLSDDEIEGRTGLPMARLLSLRVDAAVESTPATRPPPERRPRPSA